MNKLPTRKPNRLKDYDYSSDGFYFITFCTKDMKCLLSEIVGADIIRPQNNEFVFKKYNVILTDYGKIVDKAINSIESHYDTISVIKYVIMPNHVHMILCIDNNNGRMVSAPTVVGSLKRYVSKNIGNSIWQKGFYDRVIRDDNEFMYYWQYIEENPKKWNMGKLEYYS